MLRRARPLSRRGSPECSRAPGLSFRPPARLVALAVVLCALEGAGRKWLFVNPSTQAQAVLYFAKDIAFILAAVTGMRFAARSEAVLRFRQALFLSTVLFWVAALLSFSGITLVGACSRCDRW